MNTNNKRRGRRKDGKFNKICTYLNGLEINETFTSPQARNSTGVDPERLCYILIFLKDAKVIKRISRGLYQKLGYIPSFVTYNMLEANRGYKRYAYKNGKYLLKERGLPWKLGDVNPYFASVTLDKDNNLPNKFIKGAVKESISSLAEIENKPQCSTQANDNFENINNSALKIILNTHKAAMRIAENSTYGSGVSLANGKEKLLHNEKLIDFIFKPGDLVYYLEFNKVCSSLVHEIKMTWKSTVCDITYTTSHGQYTASRLFASKELLIISLLNA